MNQCRVCKNDVDRNGLCVQCADMHDVMNEVDECLKKDEAARAAEGE